MTTVGVVLITHHAKHLLPRCLPALMRATCKPRILVMNSSSKDGTVELAQEMGVETLVIPRADFNHGSTREKARKHLQTEIVVMMTPDAYFDDPCALDRLIEPIRSNQASICYARQIPHLGSDFFESFPRTYNYPAESHIRGIEDTAKYGVYTFFCSNSCAAYSNAALDEIGGFQPVLLGEDTVAVATLLRKGHKIAYVADALVRHSHRYSLIQEFKRSFDTGLARKEYAELLRCEGSDTQRGLGYVKEMMHQLRNQKPYLLPYAFLQTLAKWIGYQLGKRSTSAPLFWKKMLSSQDFYWRSKAFICAQKKSCSSKVPSSK